MSDDLVKRLRYTAVHSYLGRSVTEEAAVRIEQLERELSISRMAQVVMDNGAEALEAENARLREALTELLEVSRRAVRLSLDHDSFKLYAMEPMERAIFLSHAALKGEKP